MWQNLRFEPRSFIWKKKKNHLQAHEKSFLFYFILFYLASLTFEFTSKKVQSMQVLAIGIVLNVLTSIIYTSGVLDVS